MNNKIQETQLYVTGAVTFLDVLGWKGMWQRRESSPLQTLYEITRETKNFAATISAEYVRQPKYETLRGKAGKDITDVISISDTIAMFTEGEYHFAIEVQAKICAWLLEYALSRKFPIRGAISYGQYMRQDNIMLGAAVDEAASWYESTDWIGVILTPSAYFQVEHNRPESILQYSNIPFKNKEKNLNLCVNWKMNDDSDLQRTIESAGSLTPDIAPKYLNTRAFLKSRKIS